MAKRQFKRKLKRIKSATSDVPDAGLGLPVQEPITESRSLTFLKNHRVLLIVLGIFLIGIGSIGLVEYRYTHAFEQEAHVPLSTLVATFWQGIHNDPFTQNHSLSFLVLGLDEIANQRDNSMLTDTMMIVNVADNGRVTLISLPRDLWIDRLKTKINALYYYGEESDATNGMDLVETVVNEVTGLPISGTLVVHMETVKQVIDALGGVTVDVPKTFTDNEFPRSDVDIQTVHDPALLYESVTFNQGEQVFDGATALKYMRSRHSEDASEGNDLARVRRQQQVVQALSKEIRQPKVLLNPEAIGKLYAVWITSIKTNVAEAELVSLGWNLKDKPVTLITTQIPVQSNHTAGLLYNPPITKYNLWVYEPTDPSWQAIHTWVQTMLGNPNAS